MAGRELKFAWLSPEILEWPLHYDAAEIGEEPEGWRQPYQLWAHADHLIRAYNNKHYLADAIVNLNRIVSQRIKALMTYIGSR
jgi:hypothetical protein